MADIEDTKLCPLGELKPVKIGDLKPGETKWFCECGKSKNQPWCDGSHKGTEYVPSKWVVPEGMTEGYFCQCKLSGKKPLCDGTHRKAAEQAKASS